MVVPDDVLVSKLLNILLLISLFSVIVSTLLFFEVFSETDLQIIFLDVGQGDATLIVTPHGKQILIDGGMYRDINSKMSSYISFYDRSLDMVVATHPDLDHIGGLISVVDRYSVGYFLGSGYDSSGETYHYLLEKVSDEQYVKAASMQVIYLEEDLYLQVLWPSLFAYDSSNEHSVVIRLIYQNSSALLMADAGFPTEESLIDMSGYSISSDLLKVGHHGSKNSTSERWLTFVNPQQAVISYGCDNKFGHPHQRVTELLESYRVDVYDTCSSSDIVFQSDGNSWVNKK